MNQVVREANVYFLPAPPATPETPPAMSMWRRLRPYVRGQLWRARFALAGIRLALRPRRMPLFTEDPQGVFSEQRAELIERRPRLTPARIIDFGAARARLRPVAASR